MEEKTAGIALGMEEEERAKDKGVLSSPQPHYSSRDAETSPASPSSPTSQASGDASPSPTSLISPTAPTSPTSATSRKKPDFLRDITVEWKPLGEVAEIKIENSARKPVKASERTKGEIPYYGANNIQDYVDSYTHNGEYILLAEDGTRSLTEYSVQWVKGKFWANNHVHVISTRGRINSKFLYYFFTTMNFIPFLDGGDRAKLTKANLLRIPIPIIFPDDVTRSMEVQEQIVEILDKFTELEAELEAELVARGKQYRYYRDRLLDFGTPSAPLPGVAFLPLGEVAELGTGSSNRQDEVENGAYPFYVRSKNILKSDRYQFDEEAIILPGEGGIGDIFHYVNGKYALHQRAYRIHIVDSSIKTRFLYYYMSSAFKKYIVAKMVGATSASIRKPMLERFLIPVPPLEEQKRIVEILDKFDTLTTSLSEGLPREIELRRKQYTYYRDLLLDF